MDIVGVDLLRGGTAAAGMVGALWAGMVTLRHYQRDTRPVRFPRMLGRLGLSVDSIAGTYLESHLPTASRLCLSCQSVRACDEWLAKETSSAAAPCFCPNAAYLRLAKDAAEAR